MPPRHLPWPSICLVAEYTTMSAPSSSGFCSNGVANTLSTMTLAPALWASAETALISTMSRPGFDGVSTKTHFVGHLSASSHWFRSVPSTMVVSTPHLGKISVRIYRQDPNSARLPTTWSPACTIDAMDANTAAMPVAVALPTAAPSISAMRSWNISTVGFEKRE